MRPAAAFLGIARKRAPFVTAIIVGMTRLAMPAAAGGASTPGATAPFGGTLSAAPDPHASSAGTTCGPAWAVTQPPVVGANGGYSLTGVSAVTNQDVWSVGEQVSSGVVQPLALHWNGSNSTVVGTPNVSSQGGAQFNAVSMTGSNDGWAVGATQTGVADRPNTKYNTLAEHWNGIAWATVTTPNPGQGTNILIAASALSANNAWAVGYGAATATSSRVPLAERWNGSNWTIEPAVSEGSVGTVLLGVAGNAQNDVWAVGYSSTPTFQDQPVIERWDGTAWTVMTNDLSGTNAVLTGVSTSGPSDAWAVGYTDTFHPFTEHWDGTSWSEVPSPGLGTVQLLRSVVDISPTSAWAVGTAYIAGTTNAYEGIYTHWNGTQWVAGNLATPSSSQFQARGISAVPGSGSLWMAGGIPHTVLETLCNPNGITSAQFGVGSGHATTARTSSIGTSLGPANAGSRTNGATWGRPSASRNNLNQSSVVAVDEAAQAGIAQNTNAMASTIGDFNRDGFADIFLMRGSQQASFYLNNGNGAFQEVDSGAFPQADRWDCVSADINQDQHLDIYCTVGADHANGLKPSELYVEGPGTTFSDQASAYGLLDPSGRGRTATFINANGDNLPDLFVGNMPFRWDGLPHPNRLLINTGHGFVDAPQAGLDLPLGGSCANAGDYMSTGFQDLLLCAPTGTVHLFQNNGGRFTDVTRPAGLPNVAARDARFVDLNHDGLLDIVLVGKSQLLVYLQHPNHTFVKSFSIALTDGAGVATGDVNGDGFPDLYVVQGSSGGTNVPDLMLLNNGSGTGFVQQPIPETSIGSGDAAYPIDYARNGLTDLLVLNGISGPGPLQLISFFPAAVLSPPSGPMLLAWSHDAGGRHPASPDPATIIGCRHHAEEAVGYGP